MAEVVKISTPKPGKRRVQPWELWFSKLRESADNTIVCRAGEDFNVALEVFRNHVLNAARARELMVTTKVDKEAETVTFQFAPEMYLEES